MMQSNKVIKRAIIDKLSHLFYGFNFFLSCDIILDHEMTIEID